MNISSKNYYFGVSGIGISVLFLVGLMIISSIAPLVPGQYYAQKIFYYHVPSAWVSFLAFFLAFIFSISFLRTGNWKWDIKARISVELGLLFCTLVLFSGPIWAKPVWGSYWTWEPRLTTTLILFLIYVGYMLLRSFSDETERTARFSAVIAIIGFLDVPLVFFAVKLWSPGVQAHPQVEMVSQPQNILFPLLFMVFTFTLFFVFLFQLRQKVYEAEQKVKRRGNQL